MFHRVLLCFVLRSYLLFHLAVLQILIFLSKCNLQKVAYTSCRQVHRFGRKSRKCPGNSSAALSAITTANIGKPKGQQVMSHLENALTAAPKTSELGMGQAAPWEASEPKLQAIQIHAEGRTFLPLRAVTRGACFSLRVPEMTEYKCSLLASHLSL